MHIDWHDHISVDPEIHHGEPCIQGTRVAVSTIVGNVKAGMTIEDIINEYPQLNEEAIEAALAYDANMAWKRLMKIREKLGKDRQSNKSAVEILSEMHR